MMISSGSMLISKNALPMPKIGFLGVSKLRKKILNLIMELLMEF